MTIQQIDPNLLDPNPYQPATRLTFTPDQLADLASIRDIGIIQAPRARLMDSGRYQIVYGWRRRCAWILYRPGEQIAVDVVPATDSELFEQAAIENGQRQDLSAIEKAQIVKRAVDEFKMTQAQAGRLVGLASQGAVSNLLRLLQLPDASRDLVHSGDIPERIARQLVPITKVAAAKVQHIAQDIAKAAADDKEDIADREIGDVLRQFCVRLDSRRNWPLDWKPQIATAPACKDCPVYIKTNHSDYCGDQSCHNVKLSEWTDRELERISAKTGIPVAVGETVHVLNIEYHNEAKVHDWVKSKSQRPAELRLVANDDKRHDGYYHTDIIGSANVLIASTVKTILDRKTDEIRKDKLKTETSSEKQKREAAEAREREKRRDARSTQRKAQSDICWLVFNTAKLLEPQMTIAGGVLDYTAQLCRRYTKSPTSTWNEYVAATDQFEGKHKYWDNLYHLDMMDKIASSPPEDQKRQYILIREFAGNISGYNPETQFDWKRACNAVREIAARFRLTLPDGWDKPPIHKTDSNCWVCGRFTSTDHITKIDLAAGWQTAPDGTVTCSDECRHDVPAAAPANQPAKAKRGKQ